MVRGAHEHCEFDVQLFRLSLNVKRAERMCVYTCFAVVSMDMTKGATLAVPLIPHTHGILESSIVSYKTWPPVRNQLERSDLRRENGWSMRHGPSSPRSFCNQVNEKKR